MEQQVTKGKIYTKLGDKGYTTLLGNNRKISKANLRVEACGTLDELNAFIGFAIVALRSYDQLTILVTACLRIQCELFDLGAQLSSYPVAMEQTIITINEIQKLEEEIDAMDLQLVKVNNFIFPNNSEVVVRLHLVRTVCRRLERIVIRLFELIKLDDIVLAYLNRLSDWFFMASRYASMVLQQTETVWNRENKS